MIYLSFAIWYISISRLSLRRPINNHLFTVKWFISFVYYMTRIVHTILYIRRLLFYFYSLNKSLYSFMSTWTAQYLHTSNKCLVLFSSHIYTWMSAFTFIIILRRPCLNHIFFRCLKVNLVWLSDNVILSPVLSQNSFAIILST